LLPKNSWGEKKGKTNKEKSKGNRPKGRKFQTTKEERAKRISLVLKNLNLQVRTGCIEAH